MTPIHQHFIVVGMTTTQLPAEGRLDVGSPSERSAAADGVRAMLPWLVAVVPLGVTIGVAAGESGAHPAVGLLGGLAVLDGIAHGATGAATLTALLINVRLLAYGAAMGPFWVELDRGRRLLFAALLIDPTFANGREGYERHGVRGGHRHYMAGGVVLMCAWLLSISVGLTAGSLLPDLPVLGLFMPLFLLAEVGGHLDHRSPTVAAIVGAAVGAMAIGLPLQTGIVAGIVAGAAAGARFTDRTAS